MLECLVCYISNPESKPILHVKMAVMFMEGLRNETEAESSLSSSELQGLPLIVDSQSSLLTTGLLL